MNFYIPVLFGDEMRIIKHIAYESNILKQILKNELHMTSGFITKLKYHGNICVNNHFAKTSDFINSGDIIEITCPKSTSDNVEKVNGIVDVLYEDEDVLCVNKPPKIPTHPSLNHYTDTLANIVSNYLYKTSDELHIVTRLDNYTSGIVLIAKNSYSASIMCTKEYNLSVNKEYIGICRGIFSTKSGIIEYPISRCEESIIKRCISPMGKYAKTKYDVIEEGKEHSIVKFKLYTGRTHQIRVHCQAVNHPLLNDFLYDDINDPNKIFKLHCHQISFSHPLTRQIKTVSADFPKQFYDDFI